MKRIVTIILGMGLCMIQGSHAQNNKSLQNAFDEWKKGLYEEFDDFRRQCMQEYTDFMSNPWREFKESKPLPLPKDDKVPPVIIPKEEKKEKPVMPNPIKIDEIISPLPVIPQPTPVKPIDNVPVEKEQYLDFVFFGTHAKVRYDLGLKIRIDGVREQAVATSMRKLADRVNDNTIIDCLQLREKMQLCDWAYLQMLKELGSTAFGKGTNEATLFMAYIYMQSGYKMRLAQDGAKLYMLYASEHHIYGVPFYKMDGVSYYGIEELPSSLYICEASFPQEKSLSLIVNKEPLFDDDVAAIISKPSQHNSLIDFVSPSKNRLDFYSSYPTSSLGDNFVTRWAMYANMPMPEDMRIQFYGPMQNAIAKMGQLEAVNYILNWVQTVLEYEYDDKVWGHDRSFFPEESLYYPYCDCEDRSILLTRIVRDLLQLSCILVYYPGHLAAAVELTDEGASGDYIELQGKKFYIMDGAILSGAPVGVTMSGKDNSSAKVVLLE